MNDKIRDIPSFDDKATIAVASAIWKVIFSICLAVVLCFGFAECSIDSSVIEACEANCNKSGNTMDSVTSFKCSCKPRESTFAAPDSIMVLP
tara:strand:- start:764 stop:1039 length:276 start_codon:yes stop_codon:yes gene_type:complete